jgi:hypothetical protein
MALILAEGNCGEYQVASSVFPESTEAARSGSRELLKSVSIN